METNTDVLIAQFMGCKQVSTGIDPRFEFNDFKALSIHQYGIDTWLEETNAFNRSELMFGTSWDWLMPVVKKISNIYLEDAQRLHFESAELFEELEANLFNTDLLDTYHTVLKIIELFNNR